MRKRGCLSFLLVNYMEIITKKIKDIKPYEKNPRKNDDAVDLVANSIREFGFKVPIVIDKDNVIVTGHTRFKASKKLGLKEVPCIIADDLTEEQIQAFRLADNKVAERADWDFELLDMELGDISIDMEQFGFEFLDEFEHGKNKSATQDRLLGIENLDIENFGTKDSSNVVMGYYDIPMIEPVYELPPINEWIGFNYVLSDDNPAGKAVHFFLDDYQFERIWKDPYKYIDKLKQYVCVASPDFSPYGDMPMALQIYNHYRKHWVARVLQENGITVIPTIRASADERSFDWYLDGEPHESIVMISSMWATEESVKEIFKKEYDTMFDTLNPKKVFLYGNKINDLRGDIEYIKSFTKQRWES